MKLFELLSVTPGVTALIGSGGKTSLMYHLSSELRRRGTVACEIRGERRVEPDENPWAD